MELQMLKMLVGAGLSLLLLAGPALAQSDAETDAAVDSALGDHAAYRAVFDAIQTAVADEDAAGFAEWVDYPIAVKIDGKDVTINDEASFVADYDGILTDEIKTAIAGTKWADVMVNYQGIMLGDGQVWINGICKDDKCAEFDARVVTIQSAN
jgi:hypothetical protein